jgi:hypothetical protein
MEFQTLQGFTNQQNNSLKKKNQAGAAGLSQAGPSPAAYPDPA